MIKTFKQPNDPDYEAKKNRVLELYDIANAKSTPGKRDPNVVICMHVFGPLTLFPGRGKRGPGRVPPRRGCRHRPGASGGRPRHAPRAFATSFETRRPPCKAGPAGPPWLRTITVRWSARVSSRLRVRKVAAITGGAVAIVQSVHMSDRVTDTHQKALQINLDPRWYGTVAEIGAGQEVVRWFFQVGGAAGTIAKSISAYDMAVSDAVYGSADRYVSRSRLQAMLDHEFELNVERLQDARGDTTSFFAFADTVVARSYQGGNECHGWMGVKFQSRPRDEPSQIVLHVRMLDAEASIQQEALGIVGVNVLHGAFFQHHEPARLVESLLDQLTVGRIEIDMIEFQGIEFRSVDNRLMALQLVQLGLSGAAMFSADREVLQPSEVLRKKAIMVERGSFRPTTVVNIDMLECALAKFANDPGMADVEIIPLMELTMSNLLAGGADVDRRDFLARADLLAACGMTVLISDFFEFYRLAAYLAAMTSERIGIAMGIPTLIDLFDERYYLQLPGGILESFGRMFKNDLKLYVYPLRKTEADQLRTVDDVVVSVELQPLFDYLNRRGSFVALDNYRSEYLHIFSRDVLHLIGTRDDTWVSMVPPAVAELIKRRSFFGYTRAE